MKGTIVACDTLDGRKAAALVVDGRLDDLIVDPAGDPAAGGPPRPGTIFRALADRPMKGQGGQFVKLPGGKTGFLRQSKGTRAGQPVLVQVTGYAEPGKAAPVTQKLIFKARFAIVTPGAPGINVSRRIRDDDLRQTLTDLIQRACPEATGVILRSSAQTAEHDELVHEVSGLQSAAQAVLAQSEGSAALIAEGPDAHQIAGAEWPAEHLQNASFAELGIDDMIAEMRNAYVRLDNGASAWIEPTRALVAVDVNSGGDTSPAAGLKANISLARDLPRQLRCRGLGGQVVIDFAPLPKKDRRQIEQVLARAFRADPVDTALVGWTPLGHFELQRKRERLPTASL